MTPERIKYLREAAQRVRGRWDGWQDCKEDIPALCEYLTGAVQEIERLRGCIERLDDVLTAWEIKDVLTPGYCDELDGPEYLLVFEAKCEHRLYRESMMGLLEDPIDAQEASMWWDRVLMYSFLAGLLP